MDEFGVLTERYGIKPQGKSAPMAASKRSHSTPNPQTWKSTTTSYASSNKVSGNGSSYNGDDIFFTSSSSTTMNGASSDVFGGMNNKNSKSAHGFHADDLFGAPNSVVFGSFSSSTKQYAPVDDLLGDMAGFGLESKGLNLNNSPGFDELIPGFGATSHATRSKTTASNFVDTDPFVVLESTMSGAHSSSGMFVDPLDAFAASVSSQVQKPSYNSSTKLKPPPNPTQKVNRAKSSVDELDDFAMGTMRRSASASDAASKYREAEETKQFGVDDLDSFFSSGPRSSSVPKSRTATQVLWPGCGWEAVSLTDLITSSAVKKVYRKATLYVHPDKVQQKGATLEQKYIAEKVFDILKEAWNKFNKEELS
ncbi:hypothetical protein F2Q70_00020290 [Brassica cretica]|uniref:J domain-containing protein n=1 Tax=Brassica cretica TaxID=69181 RepID=A0A8S9GYX1_BRACR|nr:hypothetical protein F2Q70_00020290 [Brassica cretica]